jgi:hypothetical protein
MFTLSPFLKYCSIAMLFFLAVSCTGLKKSQVTAVEKYAVITKSIAALPANMYSRVYQLRSQAQALQLSGVIATNESATESIETLQSDLNDKLKFLEMVDSFAFAYEIVGRYADLIHALASESYLNDFAKNRQGWQSSFDVLIKKYNAAAQQRIPASTKIPASVGSIATDIIKQLGSAKIKALQKKYLRSAISTARNPFEGICNDFLHTDIPKIEKELAELPLFIDENYKDFLNNVKAYETKQGNSPYNYYKLYMPVYINWQVQLKELKALVKQLKICVQSLQNSYGVLDKYISLEKAGNDIPAEIGQLEIDYQLLASTVTKFAEARERLFKITY